MTAMLPEKKTMTLPELGAALGLPRSTVYYLAKDERLPVPIIRLGRRIVVPKAAVDRLLSSPTPGESGDAVGPEAA